MSYFNNFDNINDKIGKRRSRKVKFNDNIDVRSYDINQPPSNVPSLGYSSPYDELRHDKKNKKKKKKHKKYMKWAKHNKTLTVFIIGIAVFVFGAGTYYGSSKVMNYVNYSENNNGSKRRPSRRKKKKERDVDYEALELDKRRMELELQESMRQGMIRDQEKLISQIQAQLGANKKKMIQNKREFKETFGGGEKKGQVSYDSDLSEFESDSGFNTSFMLKSEADLKKRKMVELEKLLMEENNDLSQKYTELLQRLKSLDPNHPLFKLINQSKQEQLKSKQPPAPPMYTKNNNNGSMNQPNSNLSPNQMISDQASHSFPPPASNNQAPQAPQAHHLDDALDPVAELDGMMP